MSFYDEQSATEAGKGNRSKESRKSISAYRLIEIESKKYKHKSEEAMAERDRQFGRNGESISTIRNEGINDRINAIPYDSGKYENELEQNNYHEGFYVMGNRALLGRIEILSDEQLQAIGANDYISNVDVNMLSEVIKANANYTQGYMMASIFGTEKRKGGR